MGIFSSLFFCPSHSLLGLPGASSIQTLTLSMGYFVYWQCLEFNLWWMIKSGYWGWSLNFPYFQFWALFSWGHLHWLPRFPLIPLLWDFLEIMVTTYPWQLHVSIHFPCPLLCLSLVLPHTWSILLLLCQGLGVEGCTEFLVLSDQHRGNQNQECLTYRVVPLEGGTHNPEGWEWMWL